MNRLWVFDLDDTLIDNVHDYAEPILDACRLIIKTLGSRAPHVSAIVALEQEIDKRRVKETNPETGKPYLYSMSRFPGSLVEVYFEICRRAQVSPEERVARELRSIGLQAFDESRYEKNIKPRALEVMDFLGRKGDKLSLLTKGDMGVQSMKIAALKKAGFSHFSVARVVEDKNAAAFAEIMAGFNRTRYTVGNSYESDIEPAFGLGFKGIFIPVETWDVIGRTDEIMARVDKNRCFIFGSLGEIIENYEELP